MDACGGGRASGIKQIVRLKQQLHKWQNASVNVKTDTTTTTATMGTTARNTYHHHPGGGASPELSRRWSFIVCDSDEEEWQSPESPRDVPRGYLAVYVGQQDYRRFTIPTSYLSHHLFKLLLEKVEEEFGFDHGGALAIPCEIETFKYLLKCIEVQTQKGECTG